MRGLIIVLLPSLVLWLASAATLATDTPEGRTLKRSPQPVTIARDGKPQVAIMIAPDASDSIRRSANLVREHVQRISGATLEIATATTPAGLTLGTLAQFPDPELNKPLEIRNHYDGREAFVIRSDTGAIRLLATTELGVQHAATRFLELLGCRWFFMTPTWHVIPKSPSLEFALNEDSRPDIWVRDIGFDRLPQRGEPGDVSAQELFQQWVRLNRMGKSMQVTIAHAWQRVPTQVPDLFKDHPEYFALVNGQRTGPQFCVSNKGLQNAVIQYARRELDTRPALDMVSVDPADTSGWCTCAQCAKLGHYSVQPFHLANIVAAALQKSHPGKYVGVLAYSWYSMPPPFDFEPNVHVQLTRGLNAGQFTGEELYEQWTQRKKGLGIYEYYSYWQMDRNMIPGTWITDLDANAARIRDYVKRGVIDVNAQSSNNWGIHGPAYYLANRLMWDSSADVAALTQDFMTQAFGPAAVPMARYYARVSQAAEPLPGLGLGRQCIDDLEEASRLAANRPDVLARIDDIKCLLIYTYLGEKTATTTQDMIGIKLKEGVDWNARRQAFLDWFTWSYRIRNTHMIAWLTYRSSVGNPLSRQYGEEWFWRNTIKSKAKNPWRDDTPVTREELDQRLASIKAELGPVPTVAPAESSPRFTLVRFGESRSSATALPLTGRATWLLASAQGEPLRFTVQTRHTVIKLGEGVAGVEQPRDMVLEIPDARFTLTSDDGKQLHRGRLDLGTSQLDLKVPAPGIFRFTCVRGGAGWEPQFPQGAASALLLGPGQDILDVVDSPGGVKQPTIPAYFYVPKGTREIVLQAYQCGVIVIRDPRGQIAQNVPSDGRFVVIPVADDLAGKVWSLELSDEARRGRLRFLNLATALSLDPALVFVPVNTAKMDRLTPVLQ